MTQTTIQHTLWVFPVGLRAFRFATIPEAMTLLNGLFLSACNGSNVGNFTISSAVGTVATGSSISPAAFDAVVFLVRDPSQSLMPRVGATVPATVVNDPMVLGFTSIGQSGGPLAEVYWDRCFSNNEAAGAIFHEAAHAKSGLGNSMHTQTVGAPHGGPGLRVLSARGGKFPAPSGDDIDFYSNNIPKQITVRTQVP
ncbi:MAG: hypothetical protein ACLPHP_20300 [Candidatus Sulfotelmatobacter sp.]